MLRSAKLILPVLCGMMLALPGCALFSDAPHYRGVVVTQHDLNELTPGLSQQADVQAVLGPPTVVEQFDPNNWIYISQVTKMRIGQTEGVKRQHVVVVAFASNGTLQSITEKDKKDAVNVAMEAAHTPVPGGKAGFFQQLIGGVGSYNPLGAASDTSSRSLGGSSGNIGGASSGSGTAF